MSEGRSVAPPLPPRSTSSSGFLEAQRASSSSKTVAVTSRRSSSTRPLTASHTLRLVVIGFMSHLPSFELKLVVIVGAAAAVAYLCYQLFRPKTSPSPPSPPPAATEASAVTSAALIASKADAEKTQGNMKLVSGGLEGGMREGTDEVIA